MLIILENGELRADKHQNVIFKDMIFRVVQKVFQNFGSKISLRAQAKLVR